MPSYNDTANIMNVREIIDMAFGDFEGNTVNFRLLQTILYLLARQLRLLERRVEVELGPLTAMPSGSALSITEVKIHAMQKKKRKTKDEGDKRAGGVKASAGGTKSGKGRKSQSSSDKTSSDKTSTDKTSSDKTSTDKTSSDKTSTDKTSSDKTSTDKTSSDKTSTDKTSSDKTSTDKTSTDKTSSDKTSTDKTSSDKTSTDKTSTDKTSTDKTTSSKSTSSSKDKSKPSTDKTSLMGDSSGRTSKQAGSDKSTPKRGPTDAGGGMQRKLYTYPDTLATLEELKERELRIIHQRTDSFEETTKSPTPMASVHSLETQHEKILVVQRRASAESRKSALQGQGRSPQISVVTQEQFEQVAQAVRELQDRLLPVGTPGFPERAELMQELKRGASLTDAMAALQLSARLEAAEKALEHMIAMVTEIAKQTPGKQYDQTKAVSGVPSAAETRGTTKESKSPRVPDATGPGELGASTGPGALGATTGPGALGTSTEPGAVGASTGPDDSSGARGGVGPGGASGAGGVTGPNSTSGAGGKFASDSSGAHGSSAGRELANAQSTKKSPAAATQPKSPLSVEPIESTLPSQTIPAAITKAMNEDLTTDDEAKSNYITYQELRKATKELYDSLMSTVAGITARSSNNAEQAYKMSMNLEGRIESALGVSSRMADVEALVSQYADQINALDTGLSSQMTNYQEQLTTMQHDLEIGLETMAEVLGNTGGDTEAVSELNSQFTSLQVDFDNMLYRQKALKDAQETISFDLESLWKQIEMLRDIKSDREEVADALRDKAGIGELNGLVSLEQFDAVRGDFEKRIGSAYDKFNNQEILWQKAIDELVRELNEKADLIQVVSLRDEINKYLNIMKSRLQILIDVVGEPKSAMVSKKLFRNTACLSCGSPAHMDMEEPVLVPALPKFRSDKQQGEGESKIKGDGDHKVCYPGLPLPHPRDPRSHICHRYCGGSHTVVTEGPSRVPPAMAISQPVKEVVTDLGTDGKTYLVDPPGERIPCLACNIPKAPSSQHKEDLNHQAGGDITALADSPLTETQIQDEDNMIEIVSVTPPAFEVITSE